MRNNRMKLTRITCLLLLSALLSACGQPAATQPVSTPTASQPLINSNVVVASAEVVPARVSELSFPVSGPVKDILVHAGDRVQAGQALVTLDVPALSGAVAQAEAALAAADKDVEYYRVPRRQAPVLLKPKKPWHGLTAGPLEPPERLRLSQSQQAVAQVSLAVARANLAQASLTAPFDGTVTDIKIMPGEVAGVGQVVVVLASLDQLQIETTDLGEQRIISLQPGQPASVYIEALDQDLTGRVLRIAPLATKEGGDVYFRVTIALDDQPPGMFWGMSAEVQIEIE